MSADGAAAPAPRGSTSAPLLVSACLAGIPCRWDGRATTDPALVRAAQEGRAVPVCAERLGGLPTPRPPAEIVGGDGADVLAGRARVLTRDGDDVTEAFVEGAQMTVEAARHFGADTAVLQERSPSCGCGQVYDGTHSGRLVEGRGVTAAALEAAGVRVVAHRDGRAGPMGGADEGGGVVS